MKKTLQKLFFLSVIAIFMTSCMTTKTSVGQYNETEGKEYTYAKGKQVWLFWGLVPLGRTDVSTPASGDCEVITKFRFGDFLVSTLTGGIVTTYSIKVKAKREESVNVTDIHP